MSVWGTVEGESQALDCLGSVPRFFQFPYQLPCGSLQLDQAYSFL